MVTDVADATAVTGVAGITGSAIEVPITTAPRKRQDFGSSARLLGGFVGRAWLWFLAGCLVVTLLPLLFGWRPYVVESGSMQPHIKVGDVILSSPEHDEQKLLGHVTVFEDPDAAHPGTVKSHRVIKINPNGTMVTKGDANLTPDPAPLPLKNVKGIGRLLVRWIGLPVIWMQQGQWLKLGLLVFSLWLSAFLVARDHEEPELDDAADASDEPDESDDVDDPDDRDVDDLDDLDDPRDDSDGWDNESATDRPRGRLHWKPRASGLRRLRRARHRQPLRPAEFTRFIAVRFGVVVVAAAGLLVPSAQAAFSATTSAVASVWSTAASFLPNYTQDTQALNPYLYWKLDDGKGTSGNRNTTAIDYSGNSRNGLYSPTPYSNTAAWDMQEVGALSTQTPNYSVYSGGGTGTSVSCVTTNSAAENPAPVTYSEIIWFKTPAPVTGRNGKVTYYSGGGKLIGFESTKTGVSDSGQGGQYDRMVYMDSSGRVHFGVWTGATTTANSSATYNDGSWHMAVATMGGGATGDGMKLYVDGALVDSNANTTSQDYSGTNGGWWRVGCGNLQGWGSDFGTQTNYAFNGNLDEATVYTTELSAANITTLYDDATGATPPPPPPANLIVNGDFASGAVAPWTCTNGGTITGSPTHSGSSALSLTQSSFQTGQCDQSVAALANHAYTLTAYVYGTNVTVGVSGGATASKSVSPGNAWQQVTLTFTTGASGTIDVYVQNANTSLLGSTDYADDFVLS